MKAMEVNFREFITAGRRTFTIPVFQRNYEWKEPECSKLFTDLEAIAGGSMSHFVGTIVYVTSDNTNATWSEFTIIDGQQRITTVMLLLKAIHELTDDISVKDEIWDDYLTNKRAREEKYRLKLKPIESDAATWHNLMDGQTTNNSASNLWKNYALFKRKLSETRFTPQDIFEAIGKLEIVYIQLETGKENPQVIFESINSTGLSLTPGDLIRNYLLMNCDSQEKQARLYKDYWAKIESYLTAPVIPDFVRDYLTMKSGQLVKIGSVYESFKQYAQNNYAGDEEGLLTELKRFAEYYSWFRFCQSGNKELNILLRQFHEMKSYVAFEVLLYFFDECYNKNELLENELFSVIKILLSYQYRRLVCKAQYNFSLSTNALNTTYVALPREVKGAKNIPAKLLEVLAGKVRSQTFPRNEAFKSAFKTFDLYSAKLARYTLSMLENQLNPKEKVELTQDISIEHIMPQTLSVVWKADLGKNYEQIHSQWQHTIGNLTLSGNNAKLGNESFTEKKQAYKNSNFALSRDAASADTWNDKSMQDRAERLFETALQIWNLPDIYNKAASDSDIDYTISYNIMDDIRVTGETPRSFILDGDECGVDSWKSLFIGLLRRLYELDATMFEKFQMHETAIKRHLAVTDPEYKFMSPSSGREIVPGIWAETNYSSQDLLSFARIAVELYELDDYVEFTLRRKIQNRKEDNAARNASSLEEAFKDWFAAAGKAESTAQSYAVILRSTLVNTLEAQNVVEINLFSYATSEEFENAKALICALPNYAETNISKHNSFSAALSAYSAFLLPELIPD